ncbi:hypothetical protein [Senimuribacter intestinalis]|nr:hypothetical protein [Senimuribacter intestinalis]
MMAFIFAICPTLADMVEIQPISRENLGNLLQSRSNPNLKD